MQEGPATSKHRAMVPCSTGAWRLWQGNTPQHIVQRRRPQLTRVMCCAAVNFAQYDFSGLTLNRSPLIRAAIPEEGTPAYEVLGPVHATSGGHTGIGLA